MFRRVISAAIIAMAVAGGSQAAAAATCKEFADSVVRHAVQDVLDKVKADNAELQKLSEQELVNLAGLKLIEASKPDIRAYGYMMLLWYGEGEARQKVVQASVNLQSMVDKAHYHFVMALLEIGSGSPQVAQRGRDHLREIRGSGYVTFVNDEMWDQLIDKCRIAE
jgi:hypothetical protein